MKLTEWRTKALSSLAAWLSEEWVFLGLMSFCIFWPVVINGTAFFYPDSGFYLLGPAERLQDQMVWRPMVYHQLISTPIHALKWMFESLKWVLHFLPSSIGYPFVGIVELFASLILTVSFSIYIQCYLINFLIYRFSQLVVPEISKWKYGLLLLFMGTCTPLALYSSFVMTDVFSGIVILAIIGLVAYGFSNRWLWVPALIFSLAVSFSNMVAFGCFMLLNALASTRRRQRVVQWGLVSVLVVLFVIGTHFLVFSRLTLTNSGHVFLFSKMWSHNVAQAYLDQACRRDPNRYKFCGYLGEDFHIWKPNVGVLKRVGGIENIRDELRAINQDILLSRYVLVFLKAVVSSISEQVILFKDPLMPESDNAYLENEIRLVSTNELEKFHLQRLAPQRQLLSDLGSLYGAVFVLCVFYCLYQLLLRGKFVDPKWKSGVFLYFGFYLATSMTIGALSEPHSRYNNRLLWVLVLLVALKIIKDFSEKEPQTSL